MCIYLILQFNTIFNLFVCFDLYIPSIFFAYLILIFYFIFFSFTEYLIHFNSFPSFILLFQHVFHNYF